MSREYGGAGVVAVDAVVVAVVVVLVVVATVVVVVPAAYAEAAPSAAARTPRSRSQTQRRIAPVCRLVRRFAENVWEPRVPALADLGSGRQSAYDRPVENSHGAGGKEQEAHAQGPVHYGQVLQNVSAVVAPATLLTGIAFYFGWRRVNAFDGYFGLDSGALGYSSHDYILNSLNVLFLPVIVVLVVLIAMALGHAYITDAHKSGRRSPQTLHLLCQVALILGGLLLIVGGLSAFAVFPFKTPYLVATLFPAAGVLLIAHAVHQRERLRGDPPLSTAARVFVGLFVAVCLFWAAGLYAQRLGQDEAASVASHLDELPGVSFSTDSRLALPGAVPISASGYAYSHLRLLALGNGTMFLVPDGWRHGRGTLYSVSQAATTQLEFTPPSRRPSGSFAAQGATGEAPVVFTPPVTGPYWQAYLGPLFASEPFPTFGKPTSLRIRNRGGSGQPPLSLVVRLGGHAQPIVAGAAARCRVEGSRSVCTVSPIPSRHEVTLHVSSTARHPVEGQVLFRLGRLALKRPLTLSAR